MEQRNGSSLIKALAKRVLGRAGWIVLKSRTVYSQDGLYTVHNQHFRDDPRFRSAYRRGMEASHGVDPAFEWRVHTALWAAGTALRVPGDFVECGVNAGFMSSAVMHHLDWNRTGRRFYLVDTFSGPVAAQFSEEEIGRGRLKVAEDALRVGGYVTDLHRVRANFSEWPGAEIVQGSVPEVLPQVPVESVAFLHLDMNCAYPERQALEFFWDRLSPGAVVLFDDYAYRGYEEQAASVDEFAKAVGIPVLSLPTGQGVLLHP